MTSCDNISTKHDYDQKHLHWSHFSNMEKMLSPLPPGNVNLPCAGRPHNWSSAEADKQPLGEGTVFGRDTAHRNFEEDSISQVG